MVKGITYNHKIHITPTCINQSHCCHVCKTLEDMLSVWLISSLSGFLSSKDTIFYVAIFYEIYIKYIKEFKFKTFRHTSKVTNY